MERNPRLEEIAHLLTLLSRLPNYRTSPLEGDLKGPHENFYDAWFDGGAVQYVTGVTRYDFSDGSRASKPVLPGLHLGLTLADGTRVGIEQEQT